VRTSSRNVALLLFDEVELLDVAAVAQVLSLAGRQWNWRPFRLLAVAARKGRIETRAQLSIEADHELAECPPSEILVVPGGYGARRAAAEQSLVDWTRAAASEATHLVAIGAGVGLLAKTGVLDGVRVAIGAELEAWVGELSPSVIADASRSIVVDGRVLTAAAPGAALDLALELVRAVLGEKQALTVAQALSHTWKSGTETLERLRVDIVVPTD
jgi:transcriptional regulator GlxA family with amidase domain